MEDKTRGSSVDLDSEKSWDLGKRYASQLSPIPFQLNMAIKALRKLHEDSGGQDIKKFPSQANTAIKIIDKAPNLKTPLYFAASVLNPERFKAAEDDTSKALLYILGPGLFASLLGLIYFYRRIGKFAQPEAFEMLSKDILVNMEMGYILGREIDEIGVCDAVLIGAIRHIAVGTFLLRDAEAYKKYRNVKKHRLDPEHERSKWGCDHAQIGAYLLQNIGFPWDLHKIRRALLAEVTHPDLGHEHIKFAQIVYWLDSLKDGSKTPDKLGRFQITEAKFKKLIVDASKVFMDGSTFVWMKRGMEIPKRAKPQAATQSVSVEAGEAAQNGDVELAPEEDGIEQESSAASAGEE